MEQNSTQKPPSAALVPIPRTGLRGSSGILLVLALTLACIVMGVGIGAMRTTSETEVLIAEIISGVGCVLLCLHTWRISRRAKGILPILALLAAFLSYLCNSLLPAGILVALVCGVTSGALLLSVATRKQFPLLPLIPIVAYGITLLCSRDPIGSVACLLPLPAALALSFGTRRSAESENGPGRVGVLCLSTLALSLSFGGMAALTLYRRLGSLSISTLTAALDAARESVIGWFLSVEIPEGTSEALLAFFTRENIEELVNYTINLLPAIIIVFFNLISLSAQLLLHAGLVSFGCGESITDRVRVFRMSAVSCVVFLIAYLTALFGNQEVSTLVGTIAENVYTILVPGLAFAGFLRLATGLAKRRAGCMIFLVIFFLPLALLMMPLLIAIIAPILAAVEVFGRLGAFLGAKLRPSDHTDNSQDPSDHE